jgi:hypothetical protein
MRVLLTLLLTAFALIGFAKEPPPNLEPLEEVQPPPTVLDDSTPEPEVTIVKKGEETVEEYRINGQLYMMKVTPARGVPYYLTLDDQGGEWKRYDGPNPPYTMPKWILFRF